ncbi:hypothetical protein M406DRAFT_326501 [Cryphonectria parasitica EP155]|uniref:Rhodopsin domain-containing protein n=1 Tax=Cryphonectria parasitica (strain ATCC 38755 / EP155) TaxID=660469 RepID=A0A9P4YE45_CRYP1|nr:uncharacterized protein M406DRAFT_326501 [Cryphonectria parasitica EP155]KAF3771102.1 hypothetical protein M406DRAFT_326501 [Cryphonectria parasitica EP155]
MSLYEQATGLFVFFTVLTTITLGLRLFAGLILWVGLAWKSMTYEFNSPEFIKYASAKNDVCYIISGTVKISVALVLYRLDSRLFIRVILITDMIICAIWTTVVTLILGVGCTGNSPLALDASVCEATNYAQEASYVVFNGAHVLIPIIILWGVHIHDNLKWAVVALFSVGLLAVIAAGMKLHYYIIWYRPTPTTDFAAISLQTNIWAVTEHGLSLFAASILAIKPFFTYMSKSLYGTIHGGDSSHKNDLSGRSNSLGAASKPLAWPDAAESAAEMGVIGVRNEVEVRSIYDVEGDLRNPAYTVDVYNESTRRLVLGGGKENMDVGVSPA